MDSQVGESPGSYDSIDDEPMPALKRTDSGAAHGPVDAVDGDTERPLHRRDPPGANEPPPGATPEERRPRPRADDPIDEKAVALLEGAHCRPRLRAEDPIGMNAERPLNLGNRGATAPFLEELNMRACHSRGAGAAVCSSGGRQCRCHGGDDEGGTGDSCLGKKSRLSGSSLRLAASER